MSCYLERVMAKTHFGITTLPVERANCLVENTEEEGDPLSSASILTLYALQGKTIAAKWSAGTFLCLPICIPVFNFVK